MQRRKKEVIFMHYTGTIWRPPYEAGSLLLEVTAGCTWHSCKFCTLYDDLPFRFRMSPLEDVEADLLDAQVILRSWQTRLETQLQQLPESRRKIGRVFLTGANPFVLKAERLKTIAELIHRYFPECQSIGCFARVTDIALKSNAELTALHTLGYDGLTIGVETGDDVALRFMNKGYTSGDILTQTARLDDAGIGYHFFYLAGIAGADKSVESARISAGIFNQTHPRRIGSSMLTVYPESALHREIRSGNWAEAGELEKLQEVKTLIEELTIPVWFGTLGASNAVQVTGMLPQDRGAMLTHLQRACAPDNAAALRHYRTHLRHL